MRSRTIKPSFFDNEELYDAECSSGLPLRVAFAGLWCYADREGRFEWRPRRIKAAILPHDHDVDGEKVLELLTMAGFIRKYSVGSTDFGCIPTFKDHQPIHKHEAPSKCPPPPDLTAVQPLSVVRQPLSDSLQTERARVAGNNNNISNSNGSGDGSSSSEGVEGEQSPIRQRLNVEPGGEKVLAAFCATIENAEGYLGVVEAAIDGMYGNEFRITPAEAISALRDWTIKKIENPNPIVLRGFFRAQVRERERVRSSNETAASENMTSAEKILAATQKRPA